MPKKSAQSNVTAKLMKKGFGKAVKNRREEPTSFDKFAQLPGGIKNGIARLIECKIGEYKKGDNIGQPFFAMRGVCVSPVSQDGKVCKGLQLQQKMESLCDTKNREGKTTTFEDHVANMLNELRKLGVDTSDADDTEIMELLPALKEEGPYFRFTTTESPANKEKGYKAKVWEKWMGGAGLEEYDPDDEDDVVEDESGDDEVEPEEEDDVEEVEEDTEEEEEESDDSDDVDALGKAADNGDEEASTKLYELAEAVGISSDRVDNTASWAEVSEMITAAKDAGEETKEDEIPFEDSDWAPDKGELYDYKPPRARKPVECEVSAVFVKIQRVNLKSLDDGKSFKSVPWDKLIRE